MIKFFKVHNGSRAKARADLSDNFPPTHVHLPSVYTYSPTCQNQLRGLNKHVSSLQISSTSVFFHKIVRGGRGKMGALSTCSLSVSVD